MNSKSIKEDILLIIQNTEKIKEKNPLYSSQEWTEEDIEGFTVHIEGIINKHKKQE